MPMATTYRFTLCECCAVAVANGDGCHCPSDSHPDGLAAFVGLPAGVTVVTDADEVCDFSWDRCDGCRTDLAGARYGAAGLS